MRYLLIAVVMYNKNILEYAQILVISGRFMIFHIEGHLDLSFGYPQSGSYTIFICSNPQSSDMSWSQLCMGRIHKQILLTGRDFTPTFLLNMRLSSR